MAKIKCVIRVAGVGLIGVPDLRTAARLLKPDLPRQLGCRQRVDEAVPVQNVYPRFWAMKIPVRTVGHHTTPE
jgi:hypothetical protein